MRYHIRPLVSAFAWVKWVYSYLRYFSVISKSLIMSMNFEELFCFRYEDFCCRHSKCYYEEWLYVYDFSHQPFKAIASFKSSRCPIVLWTAFNRVSRIDAFQLEIKSFFEHFLEIISTSVSSERNTSYPTTPF